VRAIVLGQIPDAHASVSIAADYLSLIGVDDHIIRRAPVTIASLNRARPCLPDLDRTVLRASDHPFPFAVEGDACDVPGVAFECVERVRVRRLNVV
jgi:hypothetical protein